MEIYGVLILNIDSSVVSIYLTLHKSTFKKEVCEVYDNMHNSSLSNTSNARSQWIYYGCKNVAFHDSFIRHVSLITHRKSFNVKRELGHRANY